jgi:hypothetical protein
MKRFSAIRGFLFGAILGASITIASCGHAGINAKIYYLDAAQGGLIRKQEKEVIPFDKATGYRCMNPEDFNATLTLLKSCLDQSGARLE